MAGMMTGYDPNQFDFGYSQYDTGFNNILSSQGQTSNIPGTLGAQLGQGAIGSDNFGFMQNYGVNTAGANTGASPGFGAGYNNFMGKYGASIGQGISMAGSLFSLYGGIKSLGLMNKQFKLAKKTTKHGINAQATAYNNTVEKQEAAMRSSTAAGHPASSANYERIPQFT